MSESDTDIKNITTSQRYNKVLYAIICVLIINLINTQHCYLQYLQF